MTTTSSGSGGSDSGFCGEAKAESAKLKTQLQGLFVTTTGPAALKKLMTTLDAAYQRLGNDAPADIKPAFAVVYGEFQKMNAIYASTGYKNIKALAKIEPIFTSAKFKKAVNQLAAWGKTHHCTT